MKVLSLFDGISCGMVALERAGIPVERYIAYEIDEYAIQTSAKNYPQIEHCGDVTTADFAQYKGFDILIGGSPCTYWSIAKNNRETTADGIGGQLFMQYVRALKESECKWFLYENNFSIHQGIKDFITTQLGVKPIMINSALVSAQNRKRCYWTNIPVSLDNINKKPDLLFADIIDTASPYEYKDFSKYADTVKISKDGLNLKYDTSGKGYYSQQTRCKKTNQKWNAVTTRGNDKNDIWLNGYISRHITPLECERLQTLPDNYTEGVSNAQRYKQIGNGWTVDVVAHILKNLKD